MKVVCDACSAKYQLPEERVAGRRIKIRCRKCGSTIMVDGTSAERGQPARASLTPPAAEPAVSYYLSVNGDEQGPFAVEDLAAQIAKGTVDWSAYVWRDGYTDWKTVGSSQTLVRVVSEMRERGSFDPRISHAGDDLVDDDEPTQISSAKTARYSFRGEPIGRAAATLEPERATGTDDTTARVAVASDDLQPFARNAFAARIQQSEQRSHAQTPVVHVPDAVVSASRALNHAPTSAVRAAVAVTAARSAAGAHARELRNRLSSVRSPSSPPTLVAPQASSSNAASLQAFPAMPTRAVTSFPPPLPIAKRSVLSAAPAATLRDSSPMSLVADLESPVRAPAPAVAAYTMGDGSGLIDIRQLATLTQATGGSPVGATVQRRDPGLDPVSSFGTLAQPGLSFGTLDSLAPVSRKPASNSAALPLAILSGCAMIAAAAFAAVYITRPSATAPLVTTLPLAKVAVATAPLEHTAAQPLAQEANAPSPEVVAPSSPAIEAAVQAPSGTTLATALEQPATREVVSAVAASGKPRPAPAVNAKSAAGQSKAAVEPLAKEPAAAAVPPSLDDVFLEAPASGAVKAPAAPTAPAVGTASPSEPAAPEPTPAATTPGAAPAPATGAEPRSINSLLDDAVQDEAAPQGKPAQDTPSRDQVATAMRALEAPVTECAAQNDGPFQGTANVELTVVGATGRVLNVRVTGIQGAVGSCIARVARTASFPAFARDRFTINYPYKLTK